MYNIGIWVAVLQFFGDSPYLSRTGSVAVVFTTTINDIKSEEGEWNCGPLLTDAQYGFEGRWEVVCSIQQLTEKLGMPAPEDGIDILRLSESGLQDSRGIWTSKQNFPHREHEVKLICHLFHGQKSVSEHMKWKKRP